MELVKTPLEFGGVFLLYQIKRRFEVTHFRLTRIEERLHMPIPKELLP